MEKLGFSSQLKITVGVSFVMPLMFVRNYFQKHRWMLDCMTEL